MEESVVLACSAKSYIRYRTYTFQMHHNLHRIDNKVRMNHIITLSDDECSNEASKGTATVAIVNEKPLDLDILLNVTASPRSASDLHQIENLPRNVTIFSTFPVPTSPKIFPSQSLFLNFSPFYECRFL